MSDEVKKGIDEEMNILLESYESYKKIIKEKHNVDGDKLTIMCLAGLLFEELSKIRYGLKIIHKLIEDDIDLAG